MEKSTSHQRIEAIAAGFLDVGKYSAFVDFNAFLRTNKLEKSKTGRTGLGTWSIAYKGKKIGHFCFGQDTWSIDCFDLFPRTDWFAQCEPYLTDALKAFVLAHINTTSSCCVRSTCHSVENKIILGKMHSCRVCACRPVMIVDPDGKSLEYTKALVLIGKHIIGEMSVGCNR